MSDRSSGATGSAVDGGAAPKQQRPPSSSSSSSSTTHLSSSVSAAGGTPLDAETAAAVNEDLQYEKLKKNFDVLTAELVSVQAATTTMDACTRWIMYYYV